MSIKYFVLALATNTYATSLDKASNDDPCQPCQPSGATGLSLPTIGSGLSSLYTDVLSSVKGITWQKRESEELETRASGFCCRQSLSCVNLQNLNVPMCYDKFTTNFAFPDGSYGSLTTGDYTSGSNSANLLSGAYTVNGQQGNLYANDAAAKPNTATLAIPAQYTGTGTGSALPANQLGSIIVYTQTIPGTTYTAPTTLAQTIQVKTISGQVISQTQAATTITAPTTIAAHETAVTVTAAASSAAKTGAAAHAAIDLKGTSMVWLILYALYLV